MELKKSKEADLEKKVWVFRSLGLVMIAAVVLMAFTYESVLDSTSAIIEEDSGMEDELVFDIEIQEDEPEPEPEEGQIKNTALFRI